MAERRRIVGVDLGEEFITFTIAWYEEPVWGSLYLGRGRRSFNLGKLSFIFEFWFWRKR